MRAVSQEIPQPLTTKISLKITYIIFYSNLPGANELNISQLVVTYMKTVYSVHPQNYAFASLCYVMQCVMQCHIGICPNGGSKSIFHTVCLGWGENLHFPIYLGITYVCFVPRRLVILRRLKYKDQQFSHPSPKYHLKVTIKIYEKCMQILNLNGDFEKNIDTGGNVYHWGLSSMNHLIPLMLPGE